VIVSLFVFEPVPVNLVEEDRMHGASLLVDELLDDKDEEEDSKLGNDKTKGKQCDNRKWKRCLVSCAVVRGAREPGGRACIPWRLFQKFSD
jgi:hypothetical protein